MLIPKSMCSIEYNIICLSPKLSNLKQCLYIFTNDLPDIFDHSKTDPVQSDTTKLNCLLYADDLVLLSESEKGLQSCLEHLNSYSSRWKLKINISKTKIIIFSKGKRKWSNFRFMINDQKIEVVEKYKYLGVILAYIIINGNLKHAADQLFDRDSSDVRRFFVQLISYVIKL